MEKWKSKGRIPTLPQPLQPAAQGRKAFREDGEIQEEESGHRDQTTHSLSGSSCIGTGTRFQDHPSIGKCSSEWDTEQIGNLQVDYVLHSGRSLRGEYPHTISAVDIATSWWEAEPILRRTRENTKEGMKQIRKRLPFRLLEIHPDNDTGMINDLLWRYCKGAGIKMSRPRPYKKNDNAWVEQRNWTHVRKVVGYRRMGSEADLEVPRELYPKVCLYRNYFQPS